MAKQVKPKDEAVNADILNEAAKAANKGPSSNQPEQPAIPPPNTSVSAPVGQDVAGQQVNTGIPPANSPEVDPNNLQQPPAKSKEEIEREESEEAHRRIMEDRAADEQEKKNRLTKKYGPDYVEAEKNGLRTIFRRMTWDQLKQINGRREGWREVVAIPPEVQRLQKGS